MVWKAALTALAGYLLAGCNPAVSGCEEVIKRDLKAPSTYKRISSRSSRMTDADPPYIAVTIHYDAHNSFGTPIRSMASCDVPILPDGTLAPQEATVDLTI